MRIPGWGKKERSRKNTESNNDLKLPNSGKNKTNRQTNKKKLLHTQQAQYTTSKINGTRVTPRHIIVTVKILKDKGKKKLLKSKGEKRLIQSNKNQIMLTADFWSEKMEDRRQRANTFRVLKENCQSWIFYLAKLLS